MNPYPMNERTQACVEQRQPAVVVAMGELSRSIEELYPRLDELTRRLGSVLQQPKPTDGGKCCAAQSAEPPLWERIDMERRRIESIGNAIADIITRLEV